MTARLSVTTDKPRARRTPAEMEALKAALVDILAAENPQTVRQVYYQAVVRGLIPKTEDAYKNTIVRLLGQMRDSGRISRRWIADGNRWVFQPKTYTGPDAMLRHAAQTYRKAYWADQPFAIEVWIEKDALTGIVQDVTGPLAIPLFPTRGYASISYLSEAGENIRENRKTTYVYYLGDLDPSGLDIARNVEKRLREFAGPVPVHFERIAITWDQVQRWSLPTRPTKPTDSRAKGFDGESVELDAIPPAQLRGLVRQAVERHFDAGWLDAIQRVEDTERQSLARFAAQWRAGGAA